MNEVLVSELVRLAFGQAQILYDAMRVPAENLPAQINGISEENAKRVHLAKAFASRVLCLLETADVALTAGLLNEVARQAETRAKGQGQDTACRSAVNGRVKP